MTDEEALPSTKLLPGEARYLDTAEPGEFADLYLRHREGVRRALEAAGVAPFPAEYLVGEVFLRMMEQRAVIDRSTPLAETLSKLAQTVALEVPTPLPASPRDPEYGLGRLGPDGFYGSGAGM